jgi:hypothetical protein
MVERTAEEIEHRRARRAERREKQRDANVVRASKMHLARIASPPAPETPNDLLAGRIHIGCSGWYYWHWKGTFYPVGTPPNQLFSIYQNSFATVELNAPFYQSLRADHAYQAV